MCHNAQMYEEFSAFLQRIQSCARPSTAYVSQFSWRAMWPLADQLCALSRTWLVHQSSLHSFVTLTGVMSAHIGSSDWSRGGACNAVMHDDAILAEIRASIQRKLRTGDCCESQANRKALFFARMRQIRTWIQSSTDSICHDCRGTLDDRSSALLFTSVSPSSAIALFFCCWCCCTTYANCLVGRMPSLIDQLACDTFAIKLQLQRAPDMADNK